MKTSMRLVISITVSALACLPAPAQVPDGASNTYINATNAFVDVTIGTNGSFTLLTLGNNAMFTNAGNGVIGLNATARSNEVRLISPTARWFVGNQIHVGSNGSFNRLLVSNGATVRAFNGNLSLGTGSNNLAIVTGPGATWSNANVFYVGFNGAGNRLVISNGGTLYNNNGQLGVNSSGVSNQAVVTGAGSLWSNRSDLTIGYGGAGARLEISDGGLVRNRVGAIGAQVSASNIVALVTGVGSTWSNAAELYIGLQGPANQMIVEAGGAVRSAVGYVGANFTASNNLALITGAGSMWSNEVDLLVGAFSLNNRLVVSNGAAAAAAVDGVIGPTVNGNANSVEITGSGSRWLIGNVVYVGSNSALNQLVVTNGATVLQGDAGIIGMNSSSLSNVATITGSGSVWSNGAVLYVGVNGARNQLVISNGALVRGTTAFVGTNPSSSNNLAVVTGSGSTLSNSLDLNIGYVSSGNRMLIENGGMAFTANDAYVGVSASAISNTVVVVDPASYWHILSDLQIGSDGSLNQLMISNGAAVLTDHLFYLGYDSGANSNLLMVTGPGSSFTNHDYFFVGQGGAGNQLVVTNGASASCDGGFIGIGLNPSASNNLALVTGANSRLVFGTEFFERLDLGRFGRNNQLVVTNGGQVTGPSTTLIGFDSSGNRALVSGANSAWTGGYYLSVGQSGNGNQLLVSNQAVVAFSTNLIVGELSSSTNNRLVVDASSLFVTNAGNSAVLDVRRGTNVFNGGMIEADQLFLTNALSRFDFNGGTLITRGAAITNGFAFLMGYSGLSPAVWAVQAGVSDHGLGVPLYVGINSPFNQLLVTNGAKLKSSTFGLLGLNSGSVSNLALISGPGSMWSLTELYVGYSGNYNRIVVTNGGYVAASYTIVGGESGTTNCEAVITGVGSVLSNSLSGVLQIGSDGSTNRVRIENGGLLLGHFQVGRTLPSVGNLLSVTGPGSQIQVVTNGGESSVGFDGRASRLEITDGGAVFGYVGEMGRNISSSNNLALVMGAGSLWSNASDLFVGRSGAGNRLDVSNGAVVNNYNGFLGGNTYSSNNQVWVTGSGSVWTNRRELSVGLNGIGNQMVITNGATVFTFANKYIGNNDGALSNTVVVTDPGSTWVGDDSLYVGSAGSFNRLLVRNGGRVVNGLGTLGGMLGADGNQMLVTDGGSVWTNQQELTIGYDGRANTLVVSNGATVFSASDGFIGRSSSAASNTIIVANLGTRWLISSNLYVGSNGAFSRLVVTNGAWLENDYAAIGVGISSSNNEVVITGAGSFWTNRDALDFGVSGSGNRLAVSGGARLRSNLGYVGVNHSSSNNQVILTGPGAFWEVPNSLTFGSQSSGNRLVLSNGAAMSTVGAYVGASDLCSNNLAVITGPGSAWTNTGPMHVGYSSPANLLMITNGGLLVSTRIITVGNNSLAPANRVVIADGTLMMTSESLDIQRGTNVLDAGLMDLKQLLLTNVLGFFDFNGGTLITSGTTNNNGRAFTVGNGTNGASFQLRGGLHNFANGLTVANKGLLTGTGTVLGTVNVATGGRLSPGTTIGVMSLTNSPILQGITIMEIGRNEGALTNDQIRITGPLMYGGSLVVIDSGTSALVSGDRFSLFNAITFSGAFTNVLLPPLAVGLQWTNKLSLDGSIEVIPYLPPSVVLSIVRSNGALLVSWPTNGADYCLETTFDLSPPVLWKTVLSGITTNGGAFLFTLASTSQSPKQFFRLVFPCSQSPVTLTLQASGNLMTVSWPSNSFRLETTFNLSGPVAWQPINTGIADSNGLRTFTFTNSTAVSNQFFRLVSP